MSSPPNFASKELAQILAEQGSAIRGYAIKEKSDKELEASAEIYLLEGTSVVITLTARGYQVCYKLSHRISILHIVLYRLWGIEKYMKVWKMLCTPSALDTQRPDTQNYLASWLA